MIMLLESVFLDGPRSSLSRQTVAIQYVIGLPDEKIRFATRRSQPRSYIDITTQQALLFHRLILRNELNSYLETMMMTMIRQ